MNTHSRPGRHAGVAMALPILLAVSLAGCSGDASDEGPAAETDYGQAYALRISGDSDSPFSEPEAACLGEAVVAVVGGPEAFRAAAVTAEQIAEADDDHLSALGFEPTDDTAGDFGARFLACGIDMGAIFAAGIGGDVLDEAVACLNEQFTEDVLGEMFLAGFTGDDETAENVTVTAALECAHLIQ